MEEDNPSAEGDVFSQLPSRTYSADSIDATVVGATRTAMTEEDEDLSATFLPHRSVVGPGGTGGHFRSATTTLSSLEDHAEHRPIGNYGEMTGVFVSNVRGGRIQTDDSALAAWAVDAMRVVRDQLYRAGRESGPSVRLPYFESWAEEHRHFLRKEDDSGNEWMFQRGSDVGGEAELQLPLWATEDVGSAFASASASMLASTSVSSLDAVSDVETNNIPPSFSQEEGVAVNAARKDSSSVSVLAASTPLPKKGGGVVISDLPLMAAEVSSLLDSMQERMKAQRRRRLEKLQPPSRLRRSWYVGALAVPVAGYLGYKYIKDGMGLKMLWDRILEKAGEFYAEHISDPVKSIYRELITKEGREDVADKKARLDAIKSLQSMLLSWLDEMYPQMSEKERYQRAKNMDMSLIESRKEEDIKHIFEINNIVRMSLIEMQFIKKELMNALVAMDDLMSSNEINMKLAAMTPALIILYGLRYVFRFLFYAMFKLGKSREETYASFRYNVLDIERLLLMRDDPPSAPPPIAWGSGRKGGEQLPETKNEGGRLGEPRCSTLNAEDLGMLMLLIHECRTILSDNRRRFRRNELRNVSEDLAELAGERGAVSVQQQLQIVARMSRTYPFLKVISSGIPFESIRSV